MCGISGIIGESQQFKLVEQISEMNRLISHRGPDGEGSFICGKTDVALGHRRLAILDLSDAGKQPFVSLCGQFVATYNGEIYNYVELRQKLTELGHSFQTETDTEVLMVAYQEWGQECVSKFNGMWSFAIFDKKNEKIFCSRDRFGIKPFYFTNTGEQIIFGSEIRQLLSYATTRQVNKDILINYLIGGFENYSENTFFEGVFQLPPGHNLIVSVADRSYEIEQYYKLAPSDSLPIEPEKQISYYEELISNSIRLRLRSDVQVGGCLSGGLDSSLISSIAARENKGHGHFLAIHAKSTDINTDESYYARQAANTAEINLHEIEPANADFINALDEVILCQEEPFGGASIFMQFFVMKEAKKLGCTVLLDGQGGDETLLGYERYYPSLLLNLPFYQFISGFKNIVHKSKLSPLTLAQYFLYFMSSNVRRAVLLRRSKHIKREYYKYLDEKLIRNAAKAYRDLESLQIYEITKAQLPHLLRYEDKNSMWHSIEARLPFLDYRVVEAALALDTKVKFQDGWSKYIIRVISSKMLPKEVSWRRTKFGFEAPERNWLASIDQQMKDAVLQSDLLANILTTKDLSKLPRERLWRFYNVARWEKLFDVKMQ